MAGYERWPCRRIARQRGWVEIDKNEGGGYKNEEKKRKRGREGKMKRGAGGRKEMGGGGGEGNLFPTFHFQFSARRQELTSFRLLIATILQQTNVKLAVTQFVTETGFY